MKTFQKFISISLCTIILVIIVIESVRSRPRDDILVLRDTPVKKVGTKSILVTNSSGSFLNFKRDVCPVLHGSVALFQLSSGSHYVSHVVWNAMQSVRCYARMRGYKLYQLSLDQKLGLQVNNEASNIKELRADLEELKKLEAKCRRYTGLLAMRHCISGELLESYDYVIHLDADSGVVNPYHCFEEYITPNVDLHFLIRVHSGEIQAGHYVAKKTDFARQFLLDWANKTVVGKGTDQGILHQKLADLFLTSDQNRRCAAEHKARGYFAWVKCMRNYMITFHNRNTNVNSSATTLKPTETKNNLHKRVKFFARAQAFVRDGWSSEFKWSPADFMFHAMKSRDDVLFSHRLRLDECTDSAWLIPYKTQHIVKDVETMKGVWEKRDNTFYKIYPDFALISRLTKCWPNCADLLI
jgi:Protein of unknown function, DUF273.